MRVYVSVEYGGEKAKAKKSGLLITNSLTYKIINFFTRKHKAIQSFISFCAFSRKGWLLK